MRTLIVAAILATMFSTTALAWEKIAERYAKDNGGSSASSGSTAFRDAGRKSIQRALSQDPVGATFMLEKYNIDLDQFSARSRAVGGGTVGVARTLQASSPERPGQTARDKMDEMFALEHDPKGRSYYDPGGGSQTATRAAGIRTTAITEAVIDERRAIHHGESGGIGGSGIGGGGRNDEGVGSFGGASRDTGVSSFDGFSGGAGEMSGRSFGGIGGRF